VPHDLPVRIRRFVEEECSDGKAGVTEYRAGESTESPRRRERCDARLVEQIARAAASRLDERRDAIAKLRDGSRVDDGIRDCPSCRCDGLLKFEKVFHCTRSGR